MSNTNLGTATITFKGDFDAFERDIQRANAKVDQFNKMMASPAGQQRLEMAAMAARKLNAEMANMSRLNLIANEKVWQKQKLAQERQQERDENWLAKQEAREAKKIQRESASARTRQERDENWLAKREAKDAQKRQRDIAAADAKQKKEETATAKQEEKDARQRRKAAGQYIASGMQGMAMGGAAGMGLGASAIGAAGIASPLAADTLQGSMKLLTATIGRDFVPMVMQLSFALQDAAKWWKELDPAIKHATAETIKMVAVAGTAAVALAGVGKVLNFIASHPLAAGVGIGLGGGAFVANQIVERRDKEMEKVHKDFAGIDKQDVLNDGRMQNLRAMPDGGKKQAQKEFEEAWEKFETSRKKLADFQKNAGLTGVDWLHGGEGEKGAINKVAHNQAELEKAKIRLAAIDKAALPNGNLLDMVRGAGAGAVGNEGGRRALGSMGPSSYSSLQDFYRTFNVNATSGSSLEAQTLQIQTEMRDGILRMNQTLDQKLGKAN